MALIRFYHNKQTLDQKHTKYIKNHCCPTKILKKRITPKYIVPTGHLNKVSLIVFYLYFAPNGAYLLDVRCC